MGRVCQQLQIGNKFTLSKDLTITADMITVTKVPSVQLTDVKIQSRNGATTQLILTFNQALDTTTAPAASNFTFGGTPSNKPVFVSAEFQGNNKVLLTVGTNSIEDGLAMAVSGISGANGADILNTCNDKVTFKADNGSIVVDEITASV